MMRRSFRLLALVAILCTVSFGTVPSALAQDDGDDDGRRSPEHESADDGDDESDDGERSGTDEKDETTRRRRTDPVPNKSILRTVGGGSGNLADSLPGDASDTDGENAFQETKSGSEGEPLDRSGSSLERESDDLHQSVRYTTAGKGKVRTEAADETLEERLDMIGKCVVEKAASDDAELPKKSRFVAQLTIGSDGEVDEMMTSKTNGGSAAKECFREALSKAEFEMSEDGEVTMKVIYTYELRDGGE